MDIINKIKDGYNRIDALSDPRVQDWLFVSSPVPTYVMSLSYIILAWKVGPYLMKNREPFQLKVPLVIYNIVMTYLNYYIFKELFFGMIDAGYSYPCQSYTQDTDPKHIRIAAAIWWYYVSKLIEFIDTLFFVLRKKNNQISFLHIYHHSTMPMLWWIGTKWVPGGQSGHAAILNAFIHIVMYGYYGLSALGPSFQKYLWWKRYLTQLQLAQFSWALIIAIYTLYIDCPFPRWMSYALISYMVSFLVLFGNFYLQSYMKGAPKKRSSESSKKVQNGEAQNGVTSSNDASPSSHYNLRQRSTVKK